MTVSKQRPYVRSLQILAGAVAFIVAMGASNPARATELRASAKVYDLRGDRKKVDFNYRSEIEKSDKGQTITNTFTTSDGQVAAIETIVLGDKGPQGLQSYRVDQKQLGADGKIEIRDGRAHFSYTQGGKTKTSEEKAGDDFVVGATVVTYLQKNWAGLLKGERFKVRFGVVDRLETVGFEFTKEKEEERDGQKIVVIKMKPSSFIIAAIVNPLHFHLTADGSRLIELHGRAQVKQKDGSKYKDFDAITVYEIPAPTPAPTATKAVTPNLK